MAELLQFVVSGLTVGAVYALVALGFTIIYNASDVVNFAQGEFVMLGGMITFFANAAGLPLAPLLQSAEGALQERVAPEKREAVAKDIQADVRKFNDETVALVRDRALKLAPTTIGPILEEKFTEDELKQLATMLESPVLNKFQSLGGEIQRAMVEKLVAETRPQVEPKLRGLRETIARRLGITPTANSGAPSAAPAPAASAVADRSRRWKWVGSRGVAPVMTTTGLPALTASTRNVMVLVSAGPWVIDATPTRPVRRCQASAIPTALPSCTAATNFPPRS